MSNFTKENINKKAPLGRGLGSLLGQTNLTTTQKESVSTMLPESSSKIEERTPHDARVWKIGIDKIKPNQFQPRSHFNKEKLEELAASIKQSGIIQPILVRKAASGGYYIVAGERRWRAAQLANFHEVPVIIKDFDDKTALELAIVENVQREDLNPVEEAEAYQRLAIEFKLTQVQISEKVGKDRATIANLMRILNLPLRVKDSIAQNKLTLGHAKVLLALTSSEKQAQFADMATKQALSVRRLEKLVAEDLGKRSSEAKNITDQNVTNRLINSLSDEVQKMIGTKVTIDYNTGRGKLLIHFYSDDELTSLVDKLRNGCLK